MTDTKNNQKINDLMTNDTMKRFTLKPGIHQFAPGSHAVHHNDNLTDDEAEWYLERYPHIAALFEESAASSKAGKPERPEEEAVDTSKALKIEEPSVADITGHFIIQ